MAYLFGSAEYMPEVSEDNETAVWRPVIRVKPFGHTPAEVATIISLIIDEDVSQSDMLPLEV